MKKLRVFLISVISIIFLFNNNSYATTQGTYTTSTGIGTEKIILLAIGIIAIILVLFIGYKMDKKEENKKRREKFIKDTQNSKEENAYSSIYNPNDVSTDKNVIEEKYIEEENEVYIDEDRVEEENEVEESYNNEYRNEEETIEQFEDNINDEKNEIEDEEFFETYEDEYSDDENLEEYDEYEDVKEYDEETILEEDVKTSKTNRKIEDMINVFESSDTTMIFNSQSLKDENVDTNTQVRGYDYEEDDDDDLTELENTIKEANIRKYVRNREAEKAIYEKKTTKKYTRKKDKQEINTEKRYTRKKITNETEKELEPIIEIEKSKRGRPKKSESVQKPKRGRPKKTETTQKSKRGRPKKSAVETKAKKDATRKKSTSNTTKTTKK